MAPNLCLPECSAKRSEEALGLGSCPVGRGGSRELGDVPGQPTPAGMSRLEVYFSTSLPPSPTPVQASSYSLSPNLPRGVT